MITCQICKYQYSDTTFSKCPYCELFAGRKKIKQLKAICRKRIQKIYNIGNTAWGWRDQQRWADELAAELENENDHTSDEGDFKMMQKVGELQAEVDRLKTVLVAVQGKRDLAEAFHDIAVVQRDMARKEIERLNDVLVADNYFCAVQQDRINDLEAELIEATNRIDNFEARDIDG